MQILFTSDLHGDHHLFEDMLNLCHKRRPSLLLLGGDLFPKDSKSQKIYLSQSNFVNNAFVDYFSRLKDFQPQIEIGIMQGNDDLFVLREDLEFFEKQGLFKLIDNKKWLSRDGWRIIGFNLVPETPFQLKDLERRDVENDVTRYPAVEALSSSNGTLKKMDVTDWFESQPSIEQELATLSPIVEPSKTIFVAHAPPFDTPLDVLLDGNHVGSKAIRNFIKKNQPLLSFHGHIHESYYASSKFFVRIGNTLCFNPGQIHSPSLDAIFVDTDDILETIEHTSKLTPPTETGLKMLEAPLVK